MPEDWLLNRYDFLDEVCNHGILSTHARRSVLGHVRSMARAEKQLFRLDCVGALDALGEGGRQETVDLVVAMATARSYRESLARHCSNEALHLGLIIVVVHAGADERV